MNKLQETFKLKVKIDGQEFEAEGRSDLVTRQFEAFRLMIQGAGLVTGERPIHPEGKRPLDLTPQELISQASHSDVDLAKLFRVSPQTQLLSLRQPPGGKYPEADAVLLLLLGHKRLRNEEDVPVTVLTEALKQSGCRVKRLDRILTVYAKDHSVVRSGRGKGGKYRLTNLGLKKAEIMVAGESKVSDER
ncbi:MAG: hypothetical protein M3Z35_15450 [Nitrospirota bacterium]|nr:hypothetical protein [Nitrospirota bacterium]